MEINLLVVPLLIFNGRRRLLILELLMNLLLCQKVGVVWYRPLRLVNQLRNAPVRRLMKLMRLIGMQLEDLIERVNILKNVLYVIEDLWDSFYIDVVSEKILIFVSIHTDR